MIINRRTFGTPTLYGFHVFHNIKMCFQQQKIAHPVPYYFPSTFNNHPLSIIYISTILINGLNLVVTTESVIKVNQSKPSKKANKQKFVY